METCTKDQAIKIAGQRLHNSWMWNPWHGSDHPVEVQHVTGQCATLVNKIENDANTWYQDTTGIPTDFLSGCPAHFNQNTCQAWRAAIGFTCDQTNGGTILIPDNWGDDDLNFECPTMETCTNEQAINITGQRLHNKWMWNVGGVDDYRVEVRTVTGECAKLVKQIEQDANTWYTGTGDNPADFLSGCPAHFNQNTCQAWRAAIGFTCDQTNGGTISLPEGSQGEEWQFDCPTSS